MANNNFIIKICGVKDPVMAQLAVMAGANFVGIVFHRDSPRYVNPEQAAAISAAVREAGAIPVAVFVDHTDSEMREICDLTNINTIQLHGAISRSHHHLLSIKYKRIFVLNMSQDGSVETHKGLEYLKLDRDLILVDHKEPGKGKSISRKQFHYDLPYPWLIAGGLTPYNVSEVIADLHPDGVDVSSGVESIKGIKNPDLIKLFISTVREAHHDE